MQGLVKKERMLETGAENFLMVFMRNEIGLEVEDAVLSVE